MVFSSAFGVALALVYGAASLLVNNRALKQESQQRFMAVMVGGMIARFAGVFAVLLVVLFFLPVDSAAFVVSFLIAFVPVLVFEVLHLHRRANAVGDEVST